MKPEEGSWWRWLALLPLFWMGGGCVAVDVGKPETFIFEVPAGEETRTVAREVLFSQAVVESHGREADGGGTMAVDVSLHGLVDRIEQRGPLVNEVEATRQKRLSFGFFPGTAEWICRPEEYAPSTSLDIAEPDGTGQPPKASAGVCDLGLAVVILGSCATVLVPYFLFVEPVAGNWTCQTHGWVDGQGTCWDVTANDEHSFTKALRYWKWDGGRVDGVCHFVPFGFFRHSFLKFSEERPGKWTPRSGARHIRETLAVEGPYRVNLSIPALEFADSRMAGLGAEKVRFDLPRGEAPGEAVALVRFQEEGMVVDESQQALLEDASKWTQVVPLWLRGPEGYQVRVVVEEGRMRGASLRYAKERDAGNGGATWVVEILDDSLEALDVASFARPLILAELQAGWMERHPEEDVGSVGAWADWRSGANERTLMFSGAAFSVRPETDGWHYDAATRRGVVRLRVPEDTDVEAVRRWARENVESIARDRAAVLGAGRALPDGGLYRSLSERLDNGLLTLEFEVVQ